MSMIARFQRWLEYEKDAHAKVLASLESVPPSGQNSPEFSRAWSLMAHLVAARAVWLHRLGALDQPTSNLFPTEVDPNALVPQLHEIEAAWTHYLSSLDDSAIARTFDYRSFEGQPFRNRIEDVLTQLFTHSAYHRGQIAMLVRAAGGQPAVTDFIFWTREALD